MSETQAGDHMRPEPHLPRLKLERRGDGQAQQQREGPNEHGHPFSGQSQARLSLGKRAMVGLGAAGELWELCRRRLHHTEIAARGKPINA